MFPINVWFEKYIKKEGSSLWDIIDQTNYHARHYIGSLYILR